MSPQAHVTGWGKYVPQRVLTNNDLAQMVETSDEWITTRTGIAERRIAADDESTSSMAIKAAQKALSVANLNPTQIDLIIVATATPDHAFPSTACLVQDALGATHAAAFDLSAGCSGFVYGLSVAAGLIEAGQYENVLIIGAETLSRITDWDDRATCVLFGDGAGAVILHGNAAEGGVLSGTLGADGSGGELLCVPAGGCKRPPSHETVAEGMHYLTMKGREVFRFAVRIMPSATRKVLEMADLTIEDIDLIVPHQANQRIIASSARSLNLTPERVYSNVARYGNTSAASVPIALCEAVDEGYVHQGDVLVLVGFGAGLTWAATALQWSAPLPTDPQSRTKAVWYKVLYRYAKVRSWIRSLVRKIAAQFTKFRQ